MSSPRLRQQFDLLYQRFDGVDAEVQIEEITTILSCTRRNARIVLSKLHELGWIEWQPSSGRGKLSALRFKQSQDDVNVEMAKQLLEEGKIGRALAVLDQDVHKLTQVVQGYIGLQQRQGQQIIRLPYYRPLTLSAPLHQLRRSEKNLMLQIASGLTTIDEHENLAPDIAHHWQALSDTHWRFYLRPNVRCHNGAMLTTEQVSEHLTQLANIPLFAHISKVSITAELTVDVELSRADYRFAQLLSDVSAKLVTNWVTADDGRTYPQATGAFKIVSFDAERIVLAAFDDYFGFRPLIDQVEVVVIDEMYSNLVYPSLAHGDERPLRGHTQESVELDPGCNYLLLDRVNGLAKDPQWASYFAARLHSLAILSNLPQHKIVDLGLISAFGLKPGWQHTFAGAPVSSPNNQNIRVAFQGDHTVFGDIAKVIAKLLEDNGHTVELKRAETLKESEQYADIWIKAMGIPTRREDAIANWYLSEELFAQAADPQVHQQVLDLLQEWQASENNTFPGLAISQVLVESKQVLPTFHCWLGVNQEHSGALQNAKSNALGWFDFARVWLKPQLGG